MHIKPQQQLQQKLQHCRTAAFTARPPQQSRSRRRVARCSCSILPDQQLQQVLQPACSSSSTTTTSGSSHVAPSLLQLPHATRRDAVLVPVLGGLALQLFGYVQPQPAAASKLGAVADSAWEAMGGGPADLTFPDSW